MTDVAPQDNAGRAMRVYRRRHQGIRGMTEVGKAGLPRGGAAPRVDDKAGVEGSPDPARFAAKRDTVMPRGLSDQTQMRLGNHLRALYDGILQQPVPDRFRDLIARLDASETDTP